MSIDRTSTNPDRPTLGDIGAGASLGPYELLAPVAQGGMAVVWAARLEGHKGFQKLIALKTMLQAFSCDSRFEQMFLAEAEFASRIEHPNVCSIRDLGEDRGCLYLAMDWIDGDTLSSIETQYPAGVPIALAALIARDVALGLHSAHELRNERGAQLGLVHCDVSPQNILIAPDGVVKVVDFGLARATGAVKLGAAGHVGGKMSFMSPEQGEGKPLDRRSDVFSLGIVLYRLLTGRHPFDGETALMRFRRMRERDAPLLTPAELRPDCPKPVSDVVMRALEKSLARRFQTMKELAVALEAEVPEILEPRLRDELSAFAERAVGDTVRKRRNAIHAAMEIASRRRWERPSEPAPITLPNSELEEIAEPRARSTTTRPVALSIAPTSQAPRQRGLFWAGLFTLGAMSLLVVGVIERSASPPPDLPRVVARGRPALRPRPAAEAPTRPAAPTPIETSKPHSAARSRAPRARPPSRDTWRYDPGF
jgi:serine/threonine protein kinase